jgi:hypothetical protein
MRALAIALVAVVVVQPARSRPLADAGTSARSFDGPSIFERVQQANAARAAALLAYVATRHYSVFEPGHDTDAELVVTAEFNAPSTKTFKTIAIRGVGWIHRRVFGRLMEAEKQAAAGREAADSAITSANYDARLAGSDSLDGRECYVLELVPRRRDKYLFVGKAWIDKQDFAIARLEGEPARSPSVWVLRAPFVRQYQRIDSFWLPLQDETHSQIRFAGEYVLRIQYADYHITAKR